MSGVPEQAVCGAALRLWKGSGKRVFLRVASGSMVPLIRPGDGVTIRMGPFEDVRPGDIVAFIQDGRVFVHRLLRVQCREGRRRFRQQGDALSGWGCFDEDAFVGRVICVHRGHAMLYMDRKRWRFINRGVCLAAVGKVWLTGTVRWTKRRLMGRSNLRVGG